MPSIERLNHTRAPPVGQLPGQGRCGRCAVVELPGLCVAEMRRAGWQPEPAAAGEMLIRGGLTSDTTLQKRIQAQPLLEWKALNVRRQEGLS